MKYRQVVDMEKKKMKARKDRLDSRSSRRHLPFTILAQANVLLSNMNPIKNKIVIIRSTRIPLGVKRSLVLLADD